MSSEEPRVGEQIKKMSVSLEKARITEFSLYVKQKLGYLYRHSLYHWLGESTILQESIKSSHVLAEFRKLQKTKEC